MFARLASRFEARIDLIKDGQRVNGKSILDILMLAATWGTNLTIEASGGDAAEAVEALAGLVERTFPAEQAAE